MKDPVGVPLLILIVSGANDPPAEESEGVIITVPAIGPFAPTVKLAEAAPETPPDGPDIVTAVAAADAVVKPALVETAESFPAASA